MASAWGDSWGASWGNSWGSIETEEEEVDLGFAGGGAISGKRRRLLKQIEEEDEMILAFVSAFFQVGV